MVKPQVFVIGATGSIGKATVRALSSVYGHKVAIKAGVRKPEKAEDLKALRGVSVVQAEMGQREQLKETFKGVNALFIVCPGAMNRVELSTETAMAAEEAGVNYVLVVSVPTVERPDLTFGKQFLDIETSVTRLGVPCTFLRLPFFIDNYLGYQETIKHQSAIYGPADPTMPYTPVVVDDAGLAAAAILVSPEKHIGKAYTITSNRHSFEDVVGVFTKALGREIKYVRVSYEDAKEGLVKAGVPEWQVDGMNELWKLVDNGSPVVNRESLNDFFEITGKKPTELRSWVMRVAPAFK